MEAAPTAPTTPFNVLSIKRALKNLIDGPYSGNNRYIYIYMRPAADNSAILWNRPQKIETIFTPKRSE